MTGQSMRRAGTLVGRGRHVRSIVAVALIAVLAMPATVIGVTTTTIPLGSNIVAIEHDPIAGLTYVGYGAQIAVIDTSSRTVMGYVPTSGINDLAVNPTNGTAVIAPNSFPARITVIDGTTLSTQNISLPATLRPARVAVSASLGRAFVFGFTLTGGPLVSHLLSVDLATGATLTDVTLPGGLGDLVADDNTGRLYVPSGTGITVFDMVTLANTGTIGPSGTVGFLAFDSVGQRLYATTGSSGPEVAVIDTATDTVVETFPTTDPLFSIDVDPTTDRLFGVAFVAEGSPNVLVFEGGVQTDAVTLGTGARDVAVDPATGDAWVTVTSPFAGNVTIVSLAGAPVDANGDGIVDTLQPGTTPLDSFSDETTTPITAGSIVDRGGLSVAIADAAAPADGVTVTTGPGSGPATLSVCGFTVTVDPDSTITLTCASVKVTATAGSAKVVLGGGVTVVTIATGGAAEVGIAPGGAYSVANLGSTPITLTVDGTTSTIQPGAPPRTATTWRFVGFSQPIDNQPTVNRANSGQAIPVKFRLTSSTGAPITNLAAAQLTVTSAACSLGMTVDNIEEVTTGASGLQNLGNGNYQLNWKTPKSYAKSCKTLHLDVGDGVLHDASFEFPK